jgi:hypothetical protein
MFNVFRPCGLLSSNNRFEFALSKRRWMNGILATRVLSCRLYVIPVRLGSNDKERMRNRPTCVRFSETSLLRKTAESSGTVSISSSWSPSESRVIDRGEVESPPHMQTLRVLPVPTKSPFPGSREQSPISSGWWSSPSNDPRHQAPFGHCQVRV